MFSSTCRAPLLYLVSSRGKGQVANGEKSKITKSAVGARSCTSFGAAALIAVTMTFCAPLGGAQEMEPPRLASDKHTDAHIAEAIRQISAEHIRQTIEKLVSFQNRSTLSAQDEESVKAGKGIGAAHEWIKAEFERYSKECGGCLEVKTDAFTEQPGDRIPKPTQLTNVYAVLRGGDPAQASRIVLVTGHYDSRNSDNANGTDPAPGANDDGSGTAVSLECARVLSQASAKRKFPATIIFLTVAGEEQGLNGSKHFAQMAKEQGWTLEAVLNNDIVGGDLTAGQDAGVVRVFSEGLPSAASDAEIKRVRMLGGESDSASRELARYEFQQKDCRARNNDAPHPPRKRWEAERDGLSSTQFSFYLSGSGTTGKLRCPAASTARTPNMTLSFETFRVARVPLLTDWAYSQSAALVKRQTTSYDAAPADGSQVNVVSFSRFFVSNFTFVGGGGADANDASVAAFSRATCST